MRIVGWFLQSVFLIHLFHNSSCCGTYCVFVLSKPFPRAKISISNSILLARKEPNTSICLLWKIFIWRCVSYELINLITIPFYETKESRNIEERKVLIYQVFLICRSKPDCHEEGAEADCIFDIDPELMNGIVIDSKFD